jgi:hypothetical protein
MATTEPGGRGRCPRPADGRAAPVHTGLIEKAGGGISTETLGTIEHGRRQPQMRTLDKLARALGVEAQDLFA